MKVQANKQEAANALLIAVLGVSVLGLVLGSYLMLIRAQNISTMRAQAWNTAIPAAEGAIEEALTHINTNGSTNWASNGWTLSDGIYVKSRDFTNYSWTAGISATDPPILTSTASVATVVNGIFAAVNLNDNMA